MMKLIITGPTVRDIKEQIIESAMEFLREDAQKACIPQPQPTEPPASVTNGSLYENGKAEFGKAGAQTVVEVAEEYISQPEYPGGGDPTPKKKNKSGGGRPKKTMEEHLAKPPVEVVIEEVAEVIELEAVTKDEAIALLTKVSEKHNIDIARECLSAFKVAKLSQLKDSQLPAFAAHCKKILES